MRTLLNLPIKWKLALGFSIGLISLILVAATAIRTMISLRDTQNSIQEIQLANVIDYMKLEAGISGNRVLLSRMMRSRDPDLRQALANEIVTGSHDNDAIMGPLSERVKRDPLPPEKFQALKNAREEFNRLRDTRILPAALAGRQAEAEAAFDESVDIYKAVSTHAAELAQLARNNVRYEVEQSIALVQRAVLILGVIGALAVLFSFLAIVALQGVIASPIAGVAVAAVRIGEGELEVTAPGEERQDEIGALARAFNAMTASLRTLAGIADRIADGDLRGVVKPRSKHDRLAISFDIMSENLKGLAGEMKAGAAEAEAVAAAILDLTREFLVDIPDRDKAQRLQQTLLRLEEASKRLGIVAGQLKLPEGRQP